MWTRRNLIGTAAAGLTGLVATTRFARAQAAADGTHVHDDALYKACGEACDACAKACNASFRHCLMLAAAGKAQHARMAQIVADCAAFCALSAQMLQRGSSLALLSCTACAGACKACAQECDAPDSGQEMKMCAEACRRCEESCRKMVQDGAGERGSRANR